MRVTVAFTLVFILLAAVMVLVSAEDNDVPAAQVVASPSPRTSVTTVPAPSAPRPGPTPAPDREEPETTLVEVETGRSLRLRQPGRSVFLPQFTRDGKSLFYTSWQRPHTETAAILRVDLTAGTLRPQKVGDGFAGRMSPSGALVYTRSTGTTDELVVLAPDGEEHVLSPYAALFTATWSPDGRWLAYMTPYTAEGEELSIVLVDTVDWQARVIDETLPCHCDGGQAGFWSPSGDYFTYRHIEAYAPGGGGAKVMSPTGAMPLPQPGQIWWIDERHYVVGEERRSGGDDAGREFFVFDVATGEKVSLGESSHGEIHPHPLSREGTIAISYDDGKFARTRIIAAEGKALLDGLEGRLMGWSYDRTYLSTTSARDCPGGVNIYNAADGALARCIQGGSYVQVLAAFSPTENLVAYTQSRPLAGDLMQPSFPEPPLTSDLFLLDLETGQERQLLSDVRGWMECIRWSPDGRWLVLAGNCDFSV